MLLVFLDQVLHPVWKWCHPKMGLNDTWNDICLCLISDLLFYILVALLTMCCHDPYHGQHNQELMCYQHFQTHLVVPWIFHLFFSETCHQLGPLDLYLPNWCANVLKYDDWLSSLRLWYLELVSIRDEYFALVIFGNISLRFHTNTKLLHHSAISSTPRNTMCCCYSHSSSSLNGFCKA